MGIKRGIALLLIIAIVLNISFSSALSLDSFFKFFKKTITGAPTGSGSLSWYPSSLPNATVGRSYKASINVSGCNPCTPEFTGLPNFLSSGYEITANGTIAIIIKGTPSTADTGSYSFKIKILDKSRNIAGYKYYKLSVIPPLAVSPDSLPNATVGKHYNVSIKAVGYADYYTFEVIEIPSFLEKSASRNGDVLDLYGTPSAASVGAYTIRLSVNDSDNNRASKEYKVTVSSEGANADGVVVNLSLYPTTLPSAVASQNYSEKISAQGGIPYNGSEGYRWVVDGLPKGFAYKSLGNALEIISLPVTADAGNYSVRIAVSDSAGTSLSASYVLHIKEAVANAVSTRGFSAGEKCSSNSECLSGNCRNNICCDRDEQCCREQSECDEKSFCSVKQFYCKEKFELDKNCALNVQCISNYCKEGICSKMTEIEERIESRSLPEERTEGKEIERMRELKQTYSKTWDAIKNKTAFRRETADISMEMEVSSEGRVSDIIETTLGKTISAVVRTKNSGAKTGYVKTMIIAEGSYEVMNYLLFKENGGGIENLTLNITNFGDIKKSKEWIPVEPGETIGFYLKIQPKKEGLINFVGIAETKEGAQRRFRSRLRVLVIKPECNFVWC